MPPDSSQPIIPFEEAPAWLWERVRRALSTQPVVLVGITGAVGSGKSTLAARLALLADLPPQIIIPTDHYLPDYADVEPLHRDRPEHADLSRLSHDLGLLKAGVRASIPRWSFQTHRREGEYDVAPAPLVICEGIHALHARARDHLDLRVFVEAPAELRWQRWEVIERRGERGFGVERALAHFNTVAEPTFAHYEANYRDAAHALVRNDRGLPGPARIS